MRERELEQLLAAKATRRRFLTVSGAAAAVALTTVLPNPDLASGGPLREYPFRLGIASGDPLPDGVVIWTRLVTDPLAPLGGMEYRKFPVEWQVAADDRFSHVVREGTATALPELAHAVHVDVRGLESGREYFYRFKAGPELSPIGRTKTAPASSASPAAFAFAFASCQAWWEGYYAAYNDLAAQDLDLIVHLGDYIYEYGIPADGGVRGVSVPSRFQTETISLDQYRDRYALYKSDPDLQEAHRLFPWIVTLDDHEVENNWADDISENNDPRDEFLVRRANAFRAYWEHMPLRAPQKPTGPDMQLYRRLAFGDLAEISVLDTRQYRSDQAAGDGQDPPNPGSQDPSRTMLGDEQERWLLEGLGRSSARWNVLAQQVTLAQLDVKAGDGQIVPMDTWDGYTAARDRLFAGLRERGVENVVALTGDLHRSVAADLKLDFNDPASATVGAELTGTSVTSGRDGIDHDQTGLTLLAENPHIKYHNFQRGYVRCSLTRDEWRADYRVLPYVTQPGATAFTRASLVIENGEPGLKPA